MSTRSLSPVGTDLKTDPIARIAQAERLSAEEVAARAPVIDTGPDLVEPSRPLAPQGLSAVLDGALGAVKLPTLLELANALDDLSAQAELMSDIDPAMTEVVSAVLDDEQRKVLRYLDLREK